MTQQIQKSHRWAEQIDRREAAPERPAGQPIFFFDGDFRTWGQVQQRAQLNLAFAARLGKSSGLAL